MKHDSIILIGMAGVGKSTIGQPLADTLNYTYIDLDEYIRKMEGQTVQEIIDARGEAAFLNIEKARMYELELVRTLVAPGGSIIYNDDLMAYLKERATVIYLKDSFEDIERRLTGTTTRGIIGLKTRSLKQIYEEREPLYARYADITIECRGKSREQLVREIADLF